MIAATHRFHGHNALAFAYGRGQTVRGPGLAIRSVINGRRQTYRAAVVVSRKVHKSAVVRNRIRRRIYEQLRLSQAQITQPYDIILTVFDERLAACPASELQAAVKRLLKQSGIIDGQGSPPAGVV